MFLSVSSQRKACYARGVPAQVTVNWPVSSARVTHLFSKVSLPGAPEHEVMHDVQTWRKSKTRLTAILLFISPGQ